MPVLDREEFIEQAYFFHAFRQRLADGMPSQEILARIGEELLSTTKLPLAVGFLHTESKITGLMAPAMGRIEHYFTAFQAHVINQAELDLSRFAMDQALLVLEEAGVGRLDDAADGQQTELHDAVGGGVETGLDDQAVRGEHQLVALVAQRVGGDAPGVR